MFNASYLKVHHLTLNDMVMLFGSRKRFQTLSTLWSRFRNQSHTSFRMKDPSTGCHVSNTSLKRLFLCPTEKSENTEFPLVVISTTLVTNSSFLRYGQVDPFFSFSPCLFYVSKWVGERTEPSSYIATICTTSLPWQASSQLLDTSLFCKTPAFIIKLEATDERKKQLYYRCALRTATKVYFTSSRW